MSLQNCSTSFLYGNTSSFKAIPFIWRKTCRGLFENWRMMTFRWCSIFWYFSLAQDAFNFYLYNSSLYSKVRSFVFPNCFSNIPFTHIISVCPMMSSRYYLPLRHDPVAKAICLEHTKKNANTEVKFRNEKEFIKKIGITNSGGMFP